MCHSNDAPDVNHVFVSYGNVLFEIKMIIRPSRKPADINECDRGLKRSYFAQFFLIGSQCSLFAYSSILTHFLLVCFSPIDISQHINNSIQVDTGIATLCRSALKIYLSKTSGFTAPEHHCAGSDVGLIMNSGSAAQSSVALSNKMVIFLCSFFAVEQVHSMKCDAIERGTPYWLISLEFGSPHSSGFETPFHALWFGEDSHDGLLCCGSREKCDYNTHELQIVLYFFR